MLARDHNHIGFLKVKISWMQIMKFVYCSVGHVCIPQLVFAPFNILLSVKIGGWRRLACFSWVAASSSCLEDPPHPHLHWQFSSIQVPHRHPVSPVKNWWPLNIFMQSAHRTTLCSRWVQGRPFSFSCSFFCCFAEGFLLFPTVPCSCTRAEVSVSGWHAKSDEHCIHLWLNLFPNQLKD